MAGGISDCNQGPIVLCKQDGPLTHYCAHSLPAQGDVYDYADATEGVFDPEPLGRWHAETKEISFYAPS